jgi:hypothetical protein
LRLAAGDKKAYREKDGRSPAKPVQEYPMFRVDTEPFPVPDLPSYVWHAPVSGPEEIARDWNREMDNLEFPCPQMPAAVAQQVLDTLQEWGQARLTFVVPGYPGA